MNKIKLTESQLHRIIEESINEMLKETSDSLIRRAKDKAFNQYDDLSWKETDNEMDPKHNPFSNDERNLMNKRKRQNTAFKDELKRRRNNNAEKGKMECYLLPTDSYGQPNGNVETITLTPQEFMHRRENGEYIFKNYAEALQRALD